MYICPCGESYVQRLGYLYHLAKHAREAEKLGISRKEHAKLLRGQRLITTDEMKL